MKVSVNYCVWVVFKMQFRAHLATQFRQAFETFIGFALDLVLI